MFPSKITPTENIKELLLGKERADITRLEAIVEDRTRDLKKLVQDLSSPIIPVLENIVVVPLMGQFDENRSSELIEKTLQGVMQYRATIIIFDVTGMNELDGHVLSLLENVTQAVSLVGATPVIVGITPELSIHLVKRGVYLRDLKCFATLKHAVHYGSWRWKDCKLLPNDSSIFIARNVGLSQFHKKCNENVTLLVPQSSI